MPSSDEEIFQLLQTQPDQAIECLFREHYRYVCHAVYRVLPDMVLVEDLVQEVFYELWRKKDRLNIQTSFKAYLRRAAVNKTLNYIRDQKIKVSEPTDDLPLRSAEVTSHERLDAQDLQSAINRAVDQLPERCRAVFMLSRFEDQTYREIAEGLNISVKTVENQMSKALRHLRTALASFLPDQNDSS